MPLANDIRHYIYIAHTPDSFAYQGSDGRKYLTRAECVAKFPRLDSQEGTTL